MQPDKLGERARRSVCRSLTSEKIGDLEFKMFLDDIRGFKVLVTGSSTGIGAAAAEAFGALGAKVAVHCNRNETEANAVVARIRSSGGEAVLIMGDLRN